MMKILSSYFLTALEKNGGLIAFITLIITIILCFIGFISKERLKSKNIWMIIISTVFVLAACPVLITTLQMRLNPRMFYEIAQAQLDDGKFEDAIRSFSRVIDIDEENYISYYYRAQCNTAQFARATDSDNDMEFLLAAVGDYSVIIENLRPKMKHIVMTNEDINRFTHLIDNSVEVPDREIAAMHVTVHELQSSLPEIELSPSHEKMLPSIFCAALCNRGELARICDLYEESIDDFSELISLHPTSSTYFLRGLAELKSGEHEAALHDLSMSITLMPSSPASYCNRALARCGLKDFNSALDDIDVACSLSASNDYYLFIYGFIYAQSGDYSSALIKVNSAIANNQTNHRYYGYRGIINMYLGKYIDAVNDFDDAIDLDKAVAEYFYHRGVAKMQISDIEGCEQDFQQAFYLGYPIDEDIRNALRLR